MPKSARSRQSVAVLPPSDVKRSARRSIALRLVGGNGCSKLRRWSRPAREARDRVNKDMSTTGEGAREELLSTYFRMIACVAAVQPLFSVSATIMKPPVPCAGFSFWGFLTTVLSSAQQGQLPVVHPGILKATVLSSSLPRFEDVGQQAGLSVSHISSPAKRTSSSPSAGESGSIDCDNDGKLDIVAVNGSNVDRYRMQGGDALVTLYRQDANLKFTDITSQAGLNRKGWGWGVAGRRL